MLSLKQAILATVHYFDMFDFALAAEEIADYMYGWQAPVEAVQQEIKHISQIEESEGFYFLTGRRDLALKRAIQNQLAEKLWRKALKYSFLFALCPYVKMAAFCNSLALGSVHEQSDIDVFVITKAKRLWTARFFLKLLTQIFAVRAHHNKIAGRFCLSFFVSEKAVDLGSLARENDVHLAYFVHSIAPVFGKDAYLDFLAANSGWTAVYLRKPLMRRLHRIKKYSVLCFCRRVLETVLSIFGDRLEEFLHQRQLRRDAERKKTLHQQDGVVMTKDVFKFHEQDPRQRIAEEFSMRIEDI